MSHIITELNNLKLGQVVNSDFIVVTDVTNSLSQAETKTITLKEFTKYAITGSDILSSFRSSSHDGIFVGNLFGTSTSSSLSTTSSISNTTNYLSYSLNNGTSSYSINSNNTNNSLNSSYSTISSYAKNSTTSSISSYVNVNTVTYKTDFSEYSPLSTTSSNSQKTNYLNFDGTDNGIIYHAINSDTCSYSSVATSLNPINTTKAFGSITSSYTFTSISASYSLSSSYTDFSIKSIFSESEAHAYVTLLINGDVFDAIDDGNINNVVSIKEYFNINKVVISPGVNNSIDIIIQFENELRDEKSALIKVDSSSRVQFSDPTAYSNNIDLYNYSLIFNAQGGVDTTPWDITTGKSCSKSTAKITLIGRKYGIKSNSAEQFEVIAANVFNKSYISLIVLNGNVIGEGKNYPETPPTTIPPKC